MIKLANKLLLLGLLAEEEMEKVALTREQAKAKRLAAKARNEAGRKANTILKTEYGVDPRKVEVALGKPAREVVQEAVRPGTNALALAPGSNAAASTAADTKVHKLVRALLDQRKNARNTVRGLNSRVSDLTGQLDSMSARNSGLLRSLQDAIGQRDASDLRISELTDQLDFARTRGDNWMDSSRRMQKLWGDALDESATRGRRIARMEKARRLAGSGFSGRLGNFMRRNPKTAIAGGLATLLGAGGIGAGVNELLDDDGEA